MSKILTAVPPSQIGALNIVAPQTPQSRKRIGSAWIPEKEIVRQMDCFDARPAMNERQEIVCRDNSSLQFLRFARILLSVHEANYNPITVTLPSDAEAIFYIARGSATLTLDNTPYHLGKGDVLYVGIGQTVQIETNDLCDISEYQAVQCTTVYPTQLVRHSDIEGTPLAANLGTKRTSSERTVYKLVDSANVQACRLLFGDTFLRHEGAVGSYPPHFHGPDGEFGLKGDAKEEIYHYRVVSDIEGDVPFILQNCAHPDEKINSYFHVFDDIAIDVTPGYHDSIAPPAIRYMFTWCLGAFTENVRDWSRIYNKPHFESEW